MVRINPISDGQPVTYELFNQMIAAINNIEDQQEELQNQVIQVFGDNLSSQGEVVKIACGAVELSFAEKNANASAEATFSKRVAFSKRPYIALSVKDPSVNTITLPVPVIFEVTRTGFKVRARRLTSGVKDKDVVDKMVLNYIAVGPGKASN